MQGAFEVASGRPWSVPKGQRLQQLGLPYPPHFTPLNPLTPHTHSSAPPSSHVRVTDHFQIPPDILGKNTCSCYPAFTADNIRMLCPSAHTCTHTAHTILTVTLLSYKCLLLFQWHTCHCAHTHTASWIGLCIFFSGCNLNVLTEYILSHSGVCARARAGMCCTCGHVHCFLRRMFCSPPH